MSPIGCRIIKKMEVKERGLKKKKKKQGHSLTHMGPET